MTKSKHTKRALLASVLSMLLCLSMLIGSTFAWFTDSVTSGKNTIVAGNLDVELEYSTNPADETSWTTVEEGTNLFQPTGGATRWEPGHTEVVYLRIRNAGSLALKYQFSMNVFGNENGTEAEKEYTNVFNNKFKLSNYLVFTQTDGATKVTNREDLWLSADEELTAMGDLSRLTGKGSELLLPGESEKLTLAVYMPTQVGNEANQLTSAKTTEGDPTIYLGINLVATQAKYEQDSFNNEYDAGAELPTLVASPEELKEAITNAKDGDVIELQNDMALTEPLTIDDDITINGDGKTISGKAITAKADVKFENVVLSKPTNDSKKATLVYAIAGCENLTFEGVTFSDPQWEAIQITSKDLKTLTINNCTFTAANVDSAANKGYGAAANELIRYIHYQPATGLNPVVNFTITNNTFKNCDKITAQGAIVGMYYFSENSTLTIGGNTFENWANGDVVDGKIAAKMAIRYPRIMDFMDLEKWTGSIQTYTPLPKTSTTSET